VCKIAKEAFKKRAHPVWGYL